MLDRGFGHIATVVELRKKGLFGTTFVKKKIFWLKHTKAQEMVDEIQGKEVGTMRVRKGTSINGLNNNDLYLVALADVKHASMMLNNLSTKIINRDTKKRRVGSDLVKIKCGNF